MSLCHGKPGTSSRMVRPWIKRVNCITLQRYIAGQLAVRPEKSFEPHFEHGATRSHIVTPQTLREGKVCIRNFVKSWQT